MFYCKGKESEKFKRKGKREEGRSQAWKQTSKPNSLYRETTYSGIKIY
jgi:hypothetical protein